MVTTLREVVVSGENGEERVFKTDLLFAAAYGMNLKSAVKMINNGLPFYRNGVRYTAEYID